MRIVITLLALLVASSAWACKCRAPGDIETAVGESFERSEVVVLAEVRRERTRPGIERESVIEQRVTWRVLRSWKGPYHPGDTFRSLTTVSCCVCGQRVERGQRHLLYLDGSTTPRISTCAIGHWFDHDAQMHLLDTLSEAPQPD